MPSQTSICNAALLLLGADRIASIDDGTERARVLKDLWDDCVDQVLQAHPWNPALRRAALAADGAAPAWGWTRQFTLPSDPHCLRVWRLEDTTTPFRVEGRKLLTDAAAPLNLLFIARVTEFADWSPAMAAALECRLAWKAAYKITGSRDAALAMRDAYKDALRDARSLDGQEGTPEEVEVDELLIARL